MDGPGRHAGNSRNFLPGFPGVSNTTTLPSESLSPPNIQEKALSIIQEKAEFLKEKAITAADIDASFQCDHSPKKEHKASKLSSLARINNV
jgi:hypothetical protein